MTTGIRRAHGTGDTNGTNGDPTSSPAGLDALVREWQKPLYNLAYRMLGDANDAADATQEVFLTLVRRIDRYDPARGELRPWIYRVATREILAFGRKARRRLPREADTHDPEARVEMNEDRAPSHPDERAARREIARAVQHQVRELPDEARSLLVLHFYNGLTQGEVADALSIPRSTVQLRIRRAIELVGKRLRISGYPAVMLIDIETMMRTAAPLEVPAALQANLMQIVSGPAAGLTATTTATLGGITMANKLVVTAIIACIISLGIGFGVGRGTGGDAASGSGKDGSSSLHGAGGETAGDYESLRAAHEKTLARLDRLEAENRRLRDSDAGALGSPGSRDAATATDAALGLEDGDGTEGKKASLEGIDWDRFSSLFADISDQLMGVEVPEGGNLMSHLSPEARALLMELMSEATRIGIEGERVSENPFFDSEIFKGLTDALFSESLGLTSDQRAALAGIGSALLAEHAPPGGFENALPSERMAARAAIADEYLASMAEMLGPDQAQRWNAMEPIGDMMMNGAGRVTDLGLASADGNTIVDFWKRNYQLSPELAESPAMQGLASSYVDDARSILDRFGQTGDDPRALDARETTRMNLELAALQARTERDYLSLLPADQADRFQGLDPHLLRFLPSDGERVRVTMGGIF